MMIQPLGRFAGETAVRGGSVSGYRERTSTQSGDEAVSSGDTSSGVAGAEAGALASKQTFLTLLVAQIKNQNPLNPADGTEFLSQLAQFSELEQLISIREELEAIGKSGRPLAPADDGAGGAPAEIP